HAMMPFAAQGAAMAIEDAVLLAAHVAGSTSIPDALAAFETDRTSRIARVRARGMFNRFAYHARGPARLGRDVVLAMRPPQSLAADLDWLYGYRGRD
ncbi:MAG TPA: salicylate hydroxylase, partial [Pseudorhizobium sp.]|nr:salicylate hydroxylase [Pseudorhizobium sp.]